jgi:predicted flap endonuclease-1-like 5' DNA nuclease
MGYKIEEVEGIGPVFAEKLSGAGIATTDDLLEKCAAPKGRDTVSSSTGLSAGQLLKWSNLADLMRIKGVGPQYSELLEAAGVDTVKELRMRKAESLAQKMEEINDAKHLAKAAPALASVRDWIAQAQRIDPKITH